MQQFRPRIHLLISHLFWAQGLRSFLDSSEEWLFDREAKQILRSSKPDSSTIYRGRLSEYALTITEASHLLLANLTLTLTLIGRLLTCC